MTHKDWCGKPCGECATPCELDKSIPCSPDCPELGLEGEPNNSEECRDCDATIDPRITKDTVDMEVFELGKPNTTRKEDVYTTDDDMVFYDYGVAKKYLWIRDRYVRPDSPIYDKEYLSRMARMDNESAWVFTVDVGVGFGYDEYKTLEEAEAAFEKWKEELRELIQEASMSHDHLRVDSYPDTEIVLDWMKVFL